ncbi:DNA polymerase III subunit gamma and tau [Actinomyces weissii]|uniref:DNA polymerase III subunit gamma and tau n=1 Tax=Actinomyces weissii TaxID=675090 RepID=UPI001F467B08|nr:DNA polymerase III subunit gamma and tau [Actinomyces weissii]
MTTALYRRYRPDTFQDVIGQDHVTFPLMAALRGDRVTHAYLFSGPRGCGKTTSARILARCLNCEQAPTDTPCGTCASCRDLATGGPGSLDVVEIDAASHNGVDDARDLRERAVFAPARDRYKIFILDEAHMVTPQGFNALLKLVEEPPAHVKFIFATTEPEKVIGTIRSRTHHYPFRLVPPDLLEGYLAQLCQAERVEVGPGVFPLVTRAGGGSVRDTLSVMDQLIGGALDGSVDYQRAVALLGYTDTTLLDQCVDAIAAADGAGVFRVVDRVVSSGHDPRRFVEDLLQRLRDLLVISLAGEQAGPALGSLPVDELSRMEVQARTLGGVALSRAADATATALGQMVGATSPRLQLELLMARLLVPTTAGGAVGGAAGAAPVAGGSAGGPARVVASSEARREPGSPAAGGPAGTSAAAGRLSTAPAEGSEGGWEPRQSTDAAPAGQDVSPVRTAPAGRAAAGAAERPGSPVAPAAAGASDGSAGRPAAESPQSAGPSQGSGTARSGGERAASSRASSSIPGRAGGAGRGQGSPEGAARAQAAPAGPNPFMRESREPAAAPAPAASPAPAGGAAEAEMIRQRWGEVLEVIKRERRMSWALVSPYGQPGTLEGGVFSLLLPSAGLINTFDHGGHAEVVASALYQALGVQAQVRAVLSGGDGGPSGPGGGDGGQGPGGGGPGGQAPQTDGGWGGAATAGSASPTETAPADVQADGGSGWPPRAGVPGAPAESAAGRKGTALSGAQAEQGPTRPPQRPEGQGAAGDWEAAPDWSGTDAVQPRAGRGPERSESQPGAQRAAGASVPAPDRGGAGAAANRNGAGYVEHQTGRGSESSGQGPASHAARRSRSPAERDAVGSRSSARPGGTALSGRDHVVSGTRGAPSSEPHLPRSPVPEAEQNPFTRQAVRESPGRLEPEPEQTAAVHAESGARTGTGLSPAIRPASQAANGKPQAAPPTASAASPGAVAGAVRQGSPARASSPAHVTAPSGTPSPAHAVGPAHAASPASPASPSRSAKPLRGGGSDQGEAPLGAASASDGLTSPSVSSKPRSSAVHGEDPGFNPRYEQESAWEAPPPPEDWFGPEHDAASPWSGSEPTGAAWEVSPTGHAVSPSTSDRPGLDQGTARPVQDGPGTGSARNRQSAGSATVLRPTQGTAGSRPGQDADASWSGGDETAGTGWREGNAGRKVPPADAEPPVGTRSADPPHPDSPDTPDRPTQGTTVPQAEPGAPGPSRGPEPQLASVHRLHALPDLPPAHPAVQAGRPHITLAHRESQAAQPPRFSPLAPVSWNDPAQPPAAPEPAGTDAASGPSSPASGAPAPSSPSAGSPSPASARTPRPAAARTAAQVRSLAARKPTVSLEEDLPSEDDEDAEEAGAVGIEVVKRLLGAVVIEEVVVTQEGS